MTMDATLMVSDTVAGFIRTQDIERIRGMAAQLQLQRSHHLAAVFGDLADELEAGKAVRIVTRAPHGKG